MRADVFAVVAFLFCAILILGFIFSQYKECESRDGEFVRGVIWFKCINAVYENGHRRRD